MIRAGVAKPLEAAESLACPQPWALAVARPGGLRGLGVHVEGEFEADRDEERSILRHEYQYSELGVVGHVCGRMAGPLLPVPLRCSHDVAVLEAGRRRDAHGHREQAEEPLR